MKQILKISAITTLSIALFVATGCTKQYNDIKLPFCGGSACKTPLQDFMNCAVGSFLPATPHPWSEEQMSSFHIVKGVALDAYKYGRRIKLVEDLIGNFPINVDTFIAYGGMDKSRMFTGTDYGRQEYLACYDCFKKGDILIIALKQATGLDEYLAGLLAAGFSSGYIEERRKALEGNWVETSEDFTTFPCHNSVLWLRNDNVLGHIRFEWRENGGTKNHVSLMSWRNFQRELRGSAVIDNTGIFHDQRLFVRVDGEPDVVMRKFREMAGLGELSKKIFVQGTFTLIGLGLLSAENLCFSGSLVSGGVRIYGIDDFYFE